jgi:hypothetical protein
LAGPLAIPGVMTLRMLAGVRPPPPRPLWIISRYSAIVRTLPYAVLGNGFFGHFGDLFVFLGQSGLFPSALREPTC